MIKFMYKKSFIEFLDRYYLYLGGNFVTMGLFFFAVMGYLQFGNLFIAPLVSAFFALHSVYIFVMTGAIYGRTDKTYNAFVLAFRGFCYGVFSVVVYSLFIVVIRFYLKNGGFGIIAGVLISFLLLIWTAGTLYLPYLLCLRERKIIDSFKFSFRMFFDNPGAGSVIFVSYFFFMIASFTFFIGSSFALGLVSQVSRAFLIIDEYEREHPDEDADWKKIFEKDIQNVDDVDLKGLVMPWKKTVKKK
jgi:hypothetical protein